LLSENKLETVLGGAGFDFQNSSLKKKTSFTHTDRKSFDSANSFRSQNRPATLRSEDHGLFYEPQEIGKKESISSYEAAYAN